MTKSPRQLNGSQHNLSRSRQIAWNRKRGVKLLKSVGVRLGDKMSLFVGPAHTKSNMAAKRKFSKKATLFDSGQINSVPDGETAQNRPSRARETLASLYMYLPSHLCAALVDQRFLKECWAQDCHSGNARLSSWMWKKKSSYCVRLFQANAEI